MEAAAEGYVIDGRFRVVREIGRGGMGAVFVAEHLLTGHMRALKIVKAGSDEDVHRIVREASAASRIRSPHVVETLDAGLLPDGSAYILMELLEGESLATMTRRVGAMPLAMACELGAQACAGLAAAHDVGIVHRDIKPANLFVCTSRPPMSDPRLPSSRDVSAERPLLKIIDFGIARFDPQITDETAVTREGMALGTPYYMSPEQLRGERSIDGRADIYALGIVLYMALSARRPHQGGSIAELAISIDRGKVEPLSAHRADLPPALVTAIHRAMSPDPSARPDAQTLGALLASFARGESPAAGHWHAESTETASVAVPSSARSRPGGSGATAPSPSKRHPMTRWAVGSGVTLAVLATGYVAVRGQAPVSSTTTAPTAGGATPSASAPSDWSPETPPVIDRPPVGAAASTTTANTTAAATPVNTPANTPARASATGRAPPLPTTLDRRNPYGNVP